MIARIRRFFGYRKAFGGTIVNTRFWLGGK
jgi:hypothetical protein